jgi:hypothetical protein
VGIAVVAAVCGAVTAPAGGLRQSWSVCCLDIFATGVVGALSMQLLLCIMLPTTTDQLNAKTGDPMNGKKTLIINTQHSGNLLQASPAL